MRFTMGAARGFATQPRECNGVWLPADGEGPKRAGSGGGRCVMRLPSSSQTDGIRARCRLSVVILCDSACGAWPHTDFAIKRYTLAIAATSAAKSSFLFLDAPRRRRRAQTT